MSVLNVGMVLCRNMRLVIQSKAPEEHDRTIAWKGQRHIRLPSTMRLRASVRVSQDGESWIALKAL